jgi:YbgC/YbaW family acyl-CoA thioester hydrolase
MFYKKSYCYSCTPDFELLDPGNVLHHPNYLVLCERARIAAQAATGYSFYNLWKDGYSLAVVEVHMNYFRPVYAEQKLIILSQTREFSGVAVDVVQCILARDKFLMLLSEKKGVPPESPEFFKDGFYDFPGDLKKEDLLFKADLKLVSINLTAIKAARPPQKLKDAFGF